MINLHPQRGRRVHIAHVSQDRAGRAPAALRHLCMWTFCALGACAGCVLPGIAQVQTYADAEWIAGGSDSPAMGVGYIDDRHAISAHLNGSLKVWDVQSKQLVRVLTHGLPMIQTFTLAARSGVAVVGLNTGTILQIDVRTGRTIHSMRLHEGTVSALGISRDESLIVSGGSDMRIVVWKLASGDTVATYDGARGVVNSVDISPDNTMVVAGSDFAARLWDLRDRALLHTFQWALREVGAVRFSTSGRTLFATNFERNAMIVANGSRLFDVLTKEPLASFPGCPCRSARFTPNDEQLLIACLSDPSYAQRGKLYIYSTKDLIGFTPGDTVAAISTWSQLTSLDVSPDGAQMLIGYERNGVYSLPIPRPGLLSIGPLDSLVSHLSMVNVVAIDPQSLTLASGSYDGLVSVWNAADGFRRGILSKQGFSVRSIAFSPDAQVVATSAMDGAVRLWNARSHDMTRLLFASADHSVNSIAWSPTTGDLVGAIGPFDSTLVLWDTAIQSPKIRLVGHTRGVWSVCYSPDGRFLASGGDDATVRIWDAQSKTTTSILTEHTGRVTSLAIAPSGRLLASASDDRTIRLWAMPSGDHIATLRGHGAGVAAVDFSSDERWVISASLDSTIRVWNVGSTSEAYRYSAYPSGALSVDAAADGRSIAASYQDGTVIVWRFRTAATMMHNARATGPRIAAQPNPFTDATDITFELERAGHVRVDVFSSTGIPVGVVFDGMLGTGLHTLSWGAELPAGRYFCIIRTPHGRTTLSLIRW